MTGGSNRMSASYAIWRAAWPRPRRNWRKRQLIMRLAYVSWKRGESSWICNAADSPGATKFCAKQIKRIHGKRGMSFESSAKDAVALWPLLPECSQADVLLWPGSQKDLMPLVFPILGQPVQFRVKEMAATELPPPSDMSLSLGRHGGRLHINGQWLNELCNKVGLSGIDKGDWSCANAHQQDFLVRWLLDGMLNQLQTKLDCGPPIDISADCPGSAEGL